MWLPATWALLAVVAAWQAWNARLDAIEADERRSAAAQALAALMASQPAPTAAAEGRLESRLRVWEEALTTQRRRLEFFARDDGVPVDQSDAYFGLTRYVATMAAEAQTAGVLCRTAEAFGFASHTRSGPTMERVPLVHRQRLAAEEVLRALFEARPYRFERLQRERPEGAGAVPAASWDDTDFFEPDAASRLNSSPDSGTIAIRVTFAGDTDALRRFLNRLARPESPMIVSGVAVEPIVGVAAQPGPRPWLDGGASRFTVTVDVLPRHEDGQRSEEAL